MKKKLFIFSLFILLLIPFNVKAYSYEGASILGSELKNKGWISTWPSHSSYIKVSNSNNSKMQNYYSFYFHSVKNGSNIYVGHCAGIGKSIGAKGHDMTYIESLDTMKNNSGQSLTSTQKELLKQLLVNGYHFDTTNTKSVSSILDSKESTLSMMAMQFLVWEIVEGGRTSFSQVAPNAYNGSDSGYNVYIYPNGGAGNVTGTLYYYYSKIVNDVYKAINPTNATAFNTSTYTMTWDAANKRYSVNVTGLGDYKNCSSSNANVSITSTSSGITITSTKEVKDAEITCSYTVGSGTNDHFYYFEFQRLSGTKCSTGNCQNVLYGSGKTTYSKSFKVNSENTKLKIKKIGIDKNNLSGAKFRLTHRTETNYTLTIDGNSNDAVTINKSGEYIVSEISTPSGYEKIDDFNIRIDASTGKITNCTNQGTDLNGNTTCMKGQVGVTYSNDTILLTIVDVAKNFKIQKVDKNNNAIKGATFQIKNSNWVLKV